MMGGTIGVESEYGKGSKFYFQIEQGIVDATPISQINYDLRQNSIIDKEAESLFTAPDAHILLVDDNTMNLMVAQDLLKPLQMQIDTAENGRQAVEMVQQKQYDLVLMDHMMPVMNGTEAARAIRALPEPQYQKLPIIALTANAMTDARKEFTDAGMNGFVAKPIIFRNICNEIRKWLPDNLVKEVTPEEARELLSGSSEQENAPDIPEDAHGIFHYKEGLQCCGSESTLLKSIQIFYRTIDRNAKRIEEFLLEDLIEDYTIEVHSLKNSALLIGLPALSEAAGELEAYGTSQNKEALEEKTPPMLDMYRSLKTILLPYIQEEHDQKEVPADTWIAVLDRLHQCMEQFDTDGADEAMEQLEGFEVPEYLKESMEKLRIFVDDVAMEDVINLTTDMIDLLKQKKGGKQFLIMMEEQSYLAQSFQSAFEKHEMNTSIVNIAATSAIVNQEHPIGYLICASSELLKKTVGIKIMVDHALKNKIPVFIMGNVEELEVIWHSIPKQMINGIFTRPVNVNEMVDSICSQVDEFYQKKKKTILAVDDSGIILRKIKKLLDDKYQVILANSGAMAIKYLTLNTPDLILLDYAMPIVDGKQVMQMLREDPEFRNIPIIFLTGKNDAETVKNVMALKPDGYLLKNMDPQSLHTAIDHFFAERAEQEK